MANIRGLKSHLESQAADGCPAPGRSGKRSVRLQTDASSSSSHTLKRIGVVASYIEAPLWDFKPLM
eukprot:1147157-Pyramimonas_sp.AAC.1